MNGTTSQNSRRQIKAIKLKQLSDSPTIGRSPLVNHFKKAVTDIATSGSPNYPKLKAFLSRELWPWVWNYLKWAFTPRFEFRTYPPPGAPNDKGVYNYISSPNALKIAVAGDWGTGTQEAADVAQQMVLTNPDFTVHLGDVYYVGDDDEIDENCLGGQKHGYTGVTWPVGSRGSFALNGNHEMYANGKPYFTKLLPTVGVKGSTTGQYASFFCIETEVWRIIGLDTGYNSVGMPILGWIPLLNKIPGIGADCHFPDKLMTWLEDEVKVKSNPKPTILLSHHQYYSAFDEAYTKPARQLAKLFGDQEVVWLWGHEHRFSIYDKYPTSGDLTTYGRCVGHGGMPVDVVVKRKDTKVPAPYIDVKTHLLDPTDKETEVGENGFVILLIANNVVRLEYRDIHNTLLVEEEFTAGVGGAIQHQINIVDPQRIQKAN